MTNKQTILITGATGNIGGGAAVALASKNIGALVGACRELRELLQLNPPKPHGY